MAKKTLFVLSLLCFGVFSTGVMLQAADIEENYAYGRVSLPELQIGVGTRATALGNVGAALPLGVESLYWNPAGLHTLKATELEFSHNSWFQGVNRETLLAGLPVVKNVVLGLGFNYWSLGTVEKTGITPGGDLILENELLDLNMIGVSLGGGWRAAKTLALGAAFRIYLQQLGDEQPMTVLGDVGAQYLGLKDIVLGATLQNLGLGLAGYSLPMGLRLGVGYRWTLAKKNILLLGLDTEMLMHVLEQSVIHAGVEYEFSRVLMVRAGYQFTTAPKPDGLVGLTAGLGFKLGSWTLGYTFAPQGDLGATHRMSIGINLAGLGKGKPRPKRPAKKKPAMQPKLEHITAPSYYTRDLAVSTAITRDEAAMRSIMKDNIQIEAKVLRGKAKTKGQREVLFRIKRASGPKIVKWKLDVSDPGGQRLKRFSGKGLPDKIRWDVKDGKGKTVTDLKGIRYLLTLTDINGQKEKQQGRIGVSAQGTLPGGTGQQMKPVGTEIFGPIRFERGRAEVKSKAAKIIAKAADFIRAHPNTKVYIEGYADSVDEGSRKLVLSKARAEAVARYLTAYHKVSISRILVKGRGSKNPAGNSLNPDERYKNRRVVITVKGR